ncbi:hypothetical protein KW795_01670 [Candidatus Microgenomates bacterium]|nr:hypothetical protein [Candidatus Microgenomates bacterium]
MQERILVLQDQEIRDQAEVERLLEEIKTPRNEDYVRSVLGVEPVSTDQLIHISTPKVGVLKMVIGGKEVIVNDRIMQVADVEVDLSPTDALTKTSKYFTVEGTDLIIQATKERKFFPTPEEDERADAMLRGAVISRLTEIQGI